jgi:glutathione S-transferase
MHGKLPILYSFRRCPYAMRARFSLAYSGLQYELREVDLKNKPQELLEVSPKGTVPVLLFSDGTIIEESMDIIHYALKYNDPDNWFCQNSAILDYIVNKNDNEFVPVLRKYKYHERYPNQSKEYYLKQAEDLFIVWLEETLSGSNYLVNNQISSADIALFPFVRQFVMADQIWFNNSKYNNIRRWLESFISHPLYNIIMKKHLPY